MLHAEKLIFLVVFRQCACGVLYVLCILGTDGNSHSMVANKKIQLIILGRVGYTAYYYRGLFKFLMDVTIFKLIGAGLLAFSLEDRG